MSEPITTIVRFEQINDNAVVSVSQKTANVNRFYLRYKNKKILGA